MGVQENYRVRTGFEGKMVVVGGIDPAATHRRPSGVAILYDNNLLFLGKAYTDNEIIQPILNYKPVAVAIDSPLAYADKYRMVDLEMKRKGFRVLPPGWRSMRMLIERSLRLKNVLEGHGIAVIETHPLSALKNSGCSFEKLVELHGISISRRISRDEADALIAALVAYYYVNDKAINISAPDGIIYLLPRICDGDIH